MIPKPQEHPLKNEIQRRRLKLWEVKSLCGGSPSEGALSRYLSGKQPMPKEVEQRLEQAINRID